MTAGDFNGDRIDDLAIGAPHWSSAVGTVTIINGSRTAVGLQLATMRVYERKDLGNMVSSKGDAFGTSLSTGDFNSDGKEDLVVSAPSTGSASIHVVMGSWQGLNPYTADAWTEYTVTRRPSWPGSLKFGITLVGLPSHFEALWVS